jgi:hypothetical protein
MRKGWKQELHRLAPQATATRPGPVGVDIAVTTGSGRNWANLWNRNDPARASHPHDDRIVCLGLHHHIDIGIARDVLIDAWWSSEAT